MAKLQVAVALAIFAALVAPVGAQAANSNTPIVSERSHGEDHEKEDHEEVGSSPEDEGDDAKGEEGFEVHGDTEFDSDESFVPIPPIVIRPRVAPDANVGSHDPYEISPLAEGSAVDTINPGNHKPIRLGDVHPNQKTPVDAFTEAAYIGLGSLGLGAVALGGVAGVRAIRVRRSGKSDYYYES